MRSSFQYVRLLTINSSSKRQRIKLKLDWGTNRTNETKESFSSKSVPISVIKTLRPQTTSFSRGHLKRKKEVDGLLKEVFVGKRL